MHSLRTPISTWIHTALVAVTVCTGIVRAQSFETLGLVSVSPTMAPPLEAQALDGGSFSLSSLRGQWVVVTFWATWCGPCRAEMPTLEAFHQSVAGQGVVVLGVSIDRRAEPVGPFLQRLGVTFPNVWDHTGHAARDWRASSIPLTWIVDPAGRLVAVSRGAKDWSRLGTGFLAAAASTTDQPVPSPPLATAEAPPERPEIEPPTAKVRLEGTAVAGRPFDVAIEVEWSGRLEDYVLHPPVLVETAGLELGPLAASTRSRHGAATVVYRQQITVAQPGTRELGPIEIRYTPRGEREAMASRIEGPAVVVTPRFAGAARVAVAGGGVLAFAALGSWWWRRGSRRAEAAVVAAAADPAALERIRRARLDGDFVTCLEGLIALLRDREPQLADSLVVDLEKARYAGQAPAAPELEAAMRRAERLFSRSSDERDDFADNSTNTTFPWPPGSRAREERTT
jgi:thiol-disulfide isomerase/thioredoxin